MTTIETKIQKHRELTKIAEDAQTAADKLAADIKDADKRKILFDLDGELLDARVYVERVQTLLAIVCEEFFNETQYNSNTPEGQADIARAFDENRVLCWTANACVQTLSKAITNMTAIMKATGVTV